MMANPNVLIASMDERWKRYRAELKRCQRDFSEEAVHDLCVATRRLLAVMDICRTLDPHPRVQKVRRALKNQLDALDDLVGAPRAAGQRGGEGRLPDQLRGPEGEVMGTLAVSFERPHQFGDDELALLQGLADQGAIARVWCYAFDNPRSSRPRRSARSRTDRCRRRCPGKPRYGG